MKKIEIPKWIVETTFQCDVTKKDFKYQDLFVAWYDRRERENGLAVIQNSNFMLVKQGEFDRLKTIANGWSLSSRPLVKVLEENVILFFTDLLVVDSIHDKGNVEKRTDLRSWVELFRRLTIPHYEIARHRLSEAKQMDEFLEYTEFQLLQPETLSRFLKALEQN